MAERRYNLRVMAQANEQQLLPGISREFVARLDKLGAKQKVRAVVMLQINESGASGSTQPTRQQRAEMMAQIRQRSAEALPHIDAILERYDGERLSETVNALGSVVIETTAAGIKALAASEHVKTILEDQSLLKLTPPQR